MPLIIVNGEKIPHDSLCINANDRGITLGHGVFETILINKGSTPLIDYHWNRLTESSKLLDIKLPFNFYNLQAMINDLVSINQLKNDCNAVRLTVTDGISDRGIISNNKKQPTYILTTFGIKPFSNETMTATIVETKRNENSMASRIKSTSYLDNILAKKEAVLKGYDEAFLLNSKFNLAEGSVSNIFVIKSKMIYTPFIQDGALPGIVRHVILNLLPLNDLNIIERHISTEMLYDADEIFITNSLLGIRPIKKVDNVILKAPYKYSELIFSYYKNFINSKM